MLAKDLIQEAKQKAYTDFAKVIMTFQEETGLTVDKLCFQRGILPNKVKDVSFGDITMYINFSD